MPISHDHDELDRRIGVLRTALGRLQAEGAGPGALAPGFDELREHLWAHFEREEAPLFSFLGEVTGARVEIHALVQAHDTICALVSRLCELAAAEDTLAPVVAMFEGFETAYVLHARAEAAFLGWVGDRLDPEAAAQLDALLASL